MSKRVATDDDYDRDFYAWANHQAPLLRAGKVAEADLAHIAEEIESMGRTEKREMVSRLTVLLLHLLKWRFQPNLRSRSWRLGVAEQRIQVTSHLADNPSLKSLTAAAIADAYRVASLVAQRETGLDAGAFRAICPWSFDQIVDDAFWPD
jgi:uncharacterized protein DUF29